ncbi:MAG: sigma-70 family RNA polymerase sigma factor [Planctomycetes bacterium]|nr:sigma-70 family RNA polymerase sigma factor [Planctomycetota bacterium]
MNLTIDCPWRALDEQRPILRGWLRQRMRDDNDVEDIVQECILRAAQHRAREGDPERLTAWLIRIAENTLYDHRRRIRRRPVIQGEAEFLDSFEGREQTPGEEREGEKLQVETLSLERHRLFDGLASAIRRLNEDDQRVLDFYYSGNNGCRDIAEVAEVAPDSIKSRLFRARRKLWRIVLEELPDLEDSDAEGLLAQLEERTTAARASVRPTQAVPKSLGPRAARRASIAARLRAAQAVRSLSGGPSGAPERAPVRAARAVGAEHRGAAGSPEDASSSCGATCA